MTHNFANLSDRDFEDLARDLMGRELGVRFEAFAPGPDAGMDGRHSAAGGAVVLQAKHFHGSTFAALAARMRSERASIDRLAPARYLLVTSRPLTPANKATLAGIIGPALRDEGDIRGREDVEALLRTHPDVEKAHLKLWLSSTAVLQRVIGAASHRVSRMALDEIERKLGVYVVNPSFGEALGRLERERVLIVSGPPGVGKTTLAEMLVASLVADGWELAAIRCLDEGFRDLDDSRRQVFYFDDFLGQVALDVRALAHRDADIARFIAKVRTSPRARLVMTTRAYIFEEARLHSEHIDSHRVSVGKYVLDVGAYTRRVKAEILLNHLVQSGLPRGHIAALARSGRIRQIVDHRNYSPRLIEMMTVPDTCLGRERERYADDFLALLDDPSSLWRTAFRKHIPARSRHLLVALFFLQEYGAGIDQLRGAFGAFHAAMCRAYGSERDPKDFEEALTSLEGSFLALRGSTVAFINPSLRDFLSGYVRDASILECAAEASITARWAANVWRVATLAGPPIADAAALARRFSSLAGRFPWMRTMRRVVEDGKVVHVFADEPVTSRLSLLLDWWEASRDPAFLRAAEDTLADPANYLVEWREGRQAVELLADVRLGLKGGALVVQAIDPGLTKAITDMLQGVIAPGELQDIGSMIVQRGEEVGSDLYGPFLEAVECWADLAGQIVRDVASVAELRDYLELTGRFVESEWMLPSTAETVRVTIERRISDLEEEPERDVSISRDSRCPEAELSDRELEAMFAPLAEYCED